MANATPTLTLLATAGLLSVAVAFGASQPSGSGIPSREAGTSRIAESSKWMKKKETVTHIPSVALLPNLIHGRQLRLMTLSDENLTLRAASSPEADGVTSVLYWNKAISYDANNGRKE